MLDVILRLRYFMVVGLHQAFVAGKSGIVFY